MPGPAQDKVGVGGAALIATLRRVALFSELSEKEVRVLAERAARHRFAAGAIIFSDWPWLERAEKCKQGLFFVGRQLL